MKYIIFILTLLISSSALAKVELFVPKKTPTDYKNVHVSMHDNGQFKNCMEMGVIHSRNATVFQTKKGMFKRMRKQAGKVGATHVLIKTYDFGQALGSVFHCPATNEAFTNR